MNSANAGEKTTGRGRLFTAAIFLCLFFLYFWQLGAAGLIDPDEGRYAEIPREMIERGDYVTPRLAGLKYFEKPVLTYWLTAASFHLFGQNEFGARFPAAASALLGIAATWLLAKRRYGRDTADWSAIVLGSSFLYFVIGRIILTDMVLSAFQTIAFAAAGLALTETSSRKLRLSIFFAAMGLSVLAKGLIGLVLPGGALLLYALLSRNPGAFALFARFLPGYAIFALVTVPWFWAVASRNQDFLSFFFIHEHFLRYVTTIHQRSEPFWFFVPVLIAGFVPWTGFLPSAFTDAIRAAKTAIRGKNGQSFELFLLCWSFFIFAFFSLSESKLIPYITPALPPVAIMTAVSFHRRMELRSLRGSTALNCLFLLLLATAFATLRHYFRDGSYDLDAAYPVGMVIALSMLLLSIAFALCAFRPRPEPGRRLLYLSLALFLMTFYPVHSIVASGKSVADLCFLLNELEARGLGPSRDYAIAAYREFPQGVQFYLKKRPILVEYTGELAFGREAEPDVAEGYFQSEDEFVKRLDVKREQDIVLVIENRNILRLPEGIRRRATIMASGFNFTALRLRK